MIFGDSGIITKAPEDFRPEHIVSRRELVWPNGVRCLTLSADEPAAFRGPQFHYAWCDEICAWDYKQDVWETMRFGQRLKTPEGTPPRVVVTSTPVSDKFLLDLMADPGTRVTQGSTYENRENLDPAFFESIIRKYEGTRLGRQELHAEVLVDNPGALWKRSDIDETRAKISTEDLIRIVVAIDPAVSVSEKADETGIVVAGVDKKGDGYVLEDASGKYTPNEWARIAVSLYEKYKADRIIAEKNNGGDMVAETIRSVAPYAPVRTVHASRGKQTRAEPIAALYEQRRVHHVGEFVKLEDQMVGWDPLTDRKSPDRIDALVWGLSDLIGTATPTMDDVDLFSEMMPRLTW